MEEQKKNELGNIYGSRISKNRKWLNLLIVTHVDGKEIRITCPVRLKDFRADGKPYAEVRLLSRLAFLAEIPLYDDVKPSKAQAEAEDSDIPF